MTTDNNTSDTAVEEFSIEDTETVIKSAIGSVLTDNQYKPYVPFTFTSLLFQNNVVAIKFVLN